MGITKETINFNKEILFGEIGAVIGTQGFGYVASKITHSINVISYSVVIGAILISSLFWFLMRVYDRKIRKSYSDKKIVEDIAYIAPASAVLTIVFYYPTLFLATRYLLENHKVYYSAILAQIIAFSVFILGINIYRKILMKYYNKTL
jgi:small-conductance mechanosensitive channel